MLHLQPRDLGPWNTWHPLKALTKSSTSPPSSSAAAASSLGFSLRARNCEYRVGHDTKMTFPRLLIKEHTASIVMGKPKKFAQQSLTTNGSKETSAGRPLPHLGLDEKTNFEVEEST